MTTTDYTINNYNKFHKQIMAASKSVPTTLGGGKHGPWLFKDREDYKKLTGENITQAKIDSPGKVPHIAARFLRHHCAKDNKIGCQTQHIPLK